MAKPFIEMPPNAPRPLPAPVYEGCEILPPLVFEGFDFSELAHRVMRLKDRKNPTLPERNILWLVACETVAAHTRTGRNTAEIKRVVCRWLWNYSPALSQSESSLIRGLEKKLVRYAESGSVADGRTKENESRRAPKLSDEDRKTLIQCAVFKHGGDSDRAWWECHAHKLISEALRQRYPLPTNKRPRTPNNVRAQIQNHIRLAYSQHVGAKEAKKFEAHIDMDHSRYFAGDWIGADDKTIDCVYLSPDGTLRRGQWIPIADRRSKKILGYLFRDSEAYTQDAIRILIKKVSIKIGLPRRGWEFENGMWRHGKLLGGRTPIFGDLQSEQNFAEKLGLRIRHSRPRNPQGKLIENILHLFTKLLRSELCYVGPDEQHLVFEKAQRAILDVKAGRKTAEEAGILTFEEWEARLAQLVEEYNARPQQSKVMGGFMSPNQAWEKLQPRNAAGAIIGLDRLPEELHWLFATHREDKKVTKNGIHLPYCGGLDYRSEVTGELYGQTVRVYFDPEYPEAINVSDLKNQNIRAVPLAPKAVYDGSPDESRAAHRAKAAHNRFAKTLYRVISDGAPLPPRPVVADPASLEIGRELNRTRQETAGRETETNRLNGLERGRTQSQELDRREREAESKDTLLDFL